MITMELKIDEVARCLDIPVNTVERWIRQGRIPIHKRGNDCIFKESILKKWASTHNLLFSLGDEDTKKHQELPLENLLPVMQRGGVFYNVTGDDVTTALKSAVDCIFSLSLNTKEELCQRLVERENLTSTGIGKGVAIPHPRIPLLEVEKNPLIITCFLEKPVNFKAVDDNPVFVMFILLSASVKFHLHLLSRLSFCVRDDGFVDFLRTSPDSTEFFSRIAHFEKQLDKAETII